MNLQISHIFFDADGTLLRNENPYLSMAQSLEVRDLVKELVHQYLEEELSYQKLVELEEQIFIKQYREIYRAEPMIGDFERFFPVPVVSPGVKPMMEYLIGSKEYKVVVLSSGFYYLVKELAKFGIEYQNVYANDLLYETSGVFKEIRINVKGDKIQAFKKIVKERQVKVEDLCYVADNAFEERLIHYVLDEGGTVFYIMREEKIFEMEKFPKSSRFIKIKTLRDLKAFL